MRKATAISAGLHAAVLLWATLSFSGKSFDVTPAESLPVDFISEKDFSEMTKGVKDAPKVETPKPLVEKKSEEPPKPIEEAKPKVTEKKELQAAKEATPQPEPAPSKPDPIAEKAQTARRAQADQSRTAAAASEETTAEAAAEVRRRQDCRPCSTSATRSVMQRPASRRTQLRRLARQQVRQRSSHSRKSMLYAPG
jgi:colicin import membrane protein